MTDAMIVDIPDLHTGDLKSQTTWENMANWIVSNKTSKNIIAVIGIGDNVTAPDATHLNMAKAGWDIIDSAGIPYVVNMGNHDYDDGLVADWLLSRNITQFNAIFPLSRLSGKSWYGGAYSTTADNYYIKVNSGWRTYLIFVLEFRPRTAILTWVTNIVASNPTCDVIISTHEYLNLDGTRVGSVSGSADMWTVFSQISHLSLVISGHLGNLPGDITSSSRTTDIGYDGTTTGDLFLNYQSRTLAQGNDTMGLLTMSSDNQVLDVKTYSLYLNSYDKSYTLPLWKRMKISSTTTYPSSIKGTGTNKPRDTSGRMKPKHLVRG